MTDKVVFHLAKYFPPLRVGRTAYEVPSETLYDQIKLGKKTSEWRDFSKYWLRRLCIKRSNLFFVNGTEPLDLTQNLKVHRAWFVQGYPKCSLPRLEADITGLAYHPDSGQLEIKFANVKEVTEFRCSFPEHTNCPSCSVKTQQDCASTNIQESSAP